ncbi:hypothetical protein As57867_015541, partial [Aphanomyces stellatus]
KAEWASWLHAFIVLEHKLNPPVRRPSADLGSRPPRRGSLDATPVDCNDDGSSSEDSPVNAVIHAMRKVSFNSGVKVRTIPAVEDDDKGDLYYTEGELDRMKKNAPELAALSGKRHITMLG